MPADPAPGPPYATATVYPGPPYGTLRSQHAAALAVALSEHTLEPVPRASPPVQPRIARGTSTNRNLEEDPHSDPLVLSPSSDSDDSETTTFYEEVHHGEYQYQSRHSTEAHSSDDQDDENNTMPL